MGNSIRQNMMNKPYICAVICELQILGHSEGKAKELLVRHYRVIKRTMGWDRVLWNSLEKLTKSIKHFRENMIRMIRTRYILVVYESV